MWAVAVSPSSPVLTVRLAFVSVRSGDQRARLPLDATIAVATRQDWAVDTDPDQIKSRERVRDLAEVYTHKREVDVMLDLIPDMFKKIDSRFLEPACGNGNFLVGILARKLGVITERQHGGSPNWYEFAVLRATASIHGIDISNENITEAQERMRAVIDKDFAEKGYDPTPAFRGALSVILNANIVYGDTLNEVERIKLIEWEAGAGETFIRTPSHLEEPEHNLFYVAPEPLAAVHYGELSPELLL